MDDIRFLRRVDLAAIPNDETAWLVFAGDRLVLEHTADGYRLPSSSLLAALGQVPEQAFLLGDLGTITYFAGSIAVGDLPAPLQVMDLRQTYGVLQEIDYGLAGFAAQLAHWDRTSRFCPVCGTPTEHVPNERAKRCPACNYMQYPRVSPAIIVLIHRPGQVLLTRQASWPPNRYSLVAGFVEPGESLEQCLRREIHEEVGVRVDEIRYLGSQPWPYPHQLMVGFTALYAGDDIVVEEAELEDARWFDLDALPELSPPLSISRQIIDWHLRSQQDPAEPFPSTWYPR